MPFQSEKQRRYLWANEPEIARDWTDTYGSKIKKADGGITRIKLASGMSPGEAQARGLGAEAHGSAGGAGEGQDNRSVALKKIAEASVRDAQISNAVNRMSPGEAQARGIGAQHHGSTLTKIGKTLARGADDYQGFVPGIGLVEPPPDDWLGYPDQEEEKEGILKTITSPFKWALDKAKPYLIGGQQKAILWDLDRRIRKAKEDGDEELVNLLEEQRARAELSWADQDLYGQGEYMKDYPGALGLWGPEGEYTARAAGAAGEGLGVPINTGLTQGGGGASTAATTTTPSPYAATGVNNPFDYYVGEDPTQANLEWGEKFGVDPRTMYRTSWAADGGRIPRAFGGIMDSSTGRRAYGFGSIFKKIGKAAKKVFKSPIGKAALIGGLGWAANTWGPTAGWWGSKGKLKALAGKHDWLGKMLLNKEGNYSLGKLGIMGAGALPFFMGGQDEEDDEGIDYDLLKNQYAQELMRIKAGAMAGTLDPNKFVYQGIKEGGRAGYYAGGQSTPSDYTMEDAMMTTTQDKLGGITDVMKQADLHRQGSVGQFYAAHGGSADDKLMARVKELQDEGLDFNSAMAQAMKELSSSKAQGGRIGYAHGSAGYPPVTMGQPIQAPQMAAAPQQPNPMPAPQPNQMARMNPMMNRPMMNPMGGRRMAQEGGLMDLGGMEKDYRNDGGFVPLGGEEKADDVPARLSKNEFVFTADAVRGAGDGDIDKGAEIMENIMKNLEQGGQISEETQGLSGAQEMFGVSERLSEVV